ncbi:MAG: hypothetical protein HYR67_14995 [Bacteroidetes bacterium]|nr:hypothetical protein [Bacteroidota bacterium]
MKLYCLLAIILSHSRLFAQTAKDYFLPPLEKNVSVFKTRMPIGESKTQVFFKNMGDSASVTTMYYDDKGLRGGQEQVVKIDDTEISLIRGKANTSPGRVETYVADGQILFKMPSGDGKTEWTNPGQKGAVVTTYLAEFSRVKIDGKKRKAVKISTILRRKHSGKGSVFYVDYYVAGIGRYKRTSESGHATEILKEQKYDPNPPSVN